MIFFLKRKHWLVSTLAKQTSSFLALNITFLQKVLPNNSSSKEETLVVSEIVAK